MSALAAIWSTVAPRKPETEKTSNAASRINSLLRAWMRVLIGALVFNWGIGSHLIILDQMVKSG
jgi:hypothetical protein